MSYRLYHHLLLKLMLLAVAVDHVPAVKLPVFTFSEANRPAEIGVVKAQATCGSIVEHDLSCGTAVSWKQWTTVDASGKLQTVDKTLTVGYVIFRFFWISAARPGLLTTSTPHHGKITRTWLENGRKIAGNS